MESKSKACVVVSLVVAFAVMLFVAAGAHGLIRTASVTTEKSLVLPGTDFSGVTLLVWGVVAGVGAAVKAGATRLLSHLHN